MKHPKIIIAITAIASIYNTLCMHIKHVDNTLSDQSTRGNPLSLPFRSTPTESGSKTQQAAVGDSGTHLHDSIASNSGHGKDNTNAKVNEHPSKPPKEGKPEDQQKGPTEPSPEETNKSVQEENADNNDKKHCNPLDVDSLRSIENIKGLEYLGSGYNVTKSKPFGAENSYVDTGYTQPIIKFVWGCHPETSEKSTPIGVWVRREPACHRGHSAREIKTTKSLASMLAEDVTSSFGGGIIAVNHEAHDKKAKDDLIAANQGKYALKSQCAVLTAGMLLSVKWNLASAFQSALEPLLAFPRKEECKTMEDYQGNDLCSGYYKMWEVLFNSYGTHVISRLTMGGKLLHITEEDSLENNHAESGNRDTTTDVGFASIKAMAGSKNAQEIDLKSKSDQSNSKYFIMGGDTFIDVQTSDGWKRWVESVEVNPMPIKIELAPLSNFIPTEIKKYFWGAFNLYKHNNS